ncbi:MAG: caspase family protein [Elusimicrobiota bacterium]
MKRRAFIVVGPKSSRHGDLPGTEADAQNYVDYLQSSEGGAWNPDEISVFRNPSRAALKHALSSTWGVDYVFLAFSGHGYHIQGGELDETRLLLNDGEEMSVPEFTTGQNRELVIIDACRKVEYTAEPEGRIFANLSEVEKSGYTRLQCRALFERKVMEAEEGRIEMYSCDLNQAAGESRRGGFFTRALLDGARQWAKSLIYSGSHTLSTREAFAIAEKGTRKPQRPQYHPGRRLVHFPFDVMIR